MSDRGRHPIDVIEVLWRFKEAQIEFGRLLAACGLGDHGWRSSDPPDAARDTELILGAVLNDVPAAEDYAAAKRWRESEPTNGEIAKAAEVVGTVVRFERAGWPEINPAGYVLDVAEEFARRRVELEREVSSILDDTDLASTSAHLLRTIEELFLVDQAKALKHLRFICAQLERIAKRPPRGGID